jgi:hypothetical protein
MKQTNKKNYQNGTSTVEFAIVAAVLFIMIFGVIEIGRGYFVYSMLDEVARRASRLAVVCPVNDPAVPQMAVFNASGDGADSTLVKDLSPGKRSKPGSGRYRLPRCRRRSCRCTVNPGQFRSDPLRPLASR